MLAAVHEPLISVSRISVAISREGRTKWMYIHEKIEARCMSGRVVHERQERNGFSSRTTTRFFSWKNVELHSRRASDKISDSRTHRFSSSYELSLNRRSRCVYIPKYLFLNKWNSDAHTIFFSFARTRTEMRKRIVINRAAPKGKMFKWCQLRWLLLRLFLLASYFWFNFSGSLYEQNFNSNNNNSQLSAQYKFSSLGLLAY